MGHLLDFPDEILCKLFEYLSPFDALYAFINLNERFNCLLIPFKYQIDLTDLSYEQFMYYMNNILPIIIKDRKLNRLKLGNKRTPGQMKLFNQLINNENYRHYFNEIDRILLESSCLQELFHFTHKYLLSLPNLLTLSIKIDDIRDEDFQGFGQLIINSILPIPTLTKLSLKMSSAFGLSRLSNTITFPSLVYIQLNLSLITDLLILIPRIPNVETLLIGINWWTNPGQTLVRLLNEMGNNQLNHLKKFHLTINSIVQFQFDEFEQILSRTINPQMTLNFSLILHNNLLVNDQTNKLIDGYQWEQLLTHYPSLIQFDLFIPISKSGKIEDDLIKFQSFNSTYFQNKQWFFSYLKYSTTDGIILYSIPYKNKQQFDILINDNIIFNNFPVNYSPLLTIDHKNDTKYSLTSDFIVKHFPFLEELSVMNIDTNISPINSVDIPSLHTLKIVGGYDINLPNLFQLFPLINRLFLSFYYINNSCIHQYNQIIELHLNGISENNIDKILIFLKQFPNLRYLHIHIQNRYLDNEILLSNLNNIIQTFSSLVSMKIQLDKDFQYDQLNPRLKMYLTDSTPNGVLLHLWF